MAVEWQVVEREQEENSYTCCKIGHEEGIVRDDDVNGMFVSSKARMLKS